MPLVLADGSSISKKWIEGMIQDVEEKMAAMQIAFDEMVDKLIEVLESIQSYLNDDDVESAAGLLESTLEEVKKSAGGE